VILSDINHKELKVLTSDIQLCSEISSGLKLGNYQLHDLVQLGPQCIGVITRVDREGFEVIDSYGNVKNAKLQEILHKKNSRKAIARDSNKNPVGTGDTIRVIDGKFKGYQGVVKHIVKNFAFVHSPNYKNNSGIFVVNTQKQCKIVGTSKNQTMAGIHGKNVSQSITRNISRQRSSNRNDPLLHKLVKIKSGNWRGYVGIVKDASKEKVTVELQTNAQRIQVPRSSVSETLEEKKPIDSGPTPSRTMTPHRPNTPMVNDPYSTGRTPSHPSTPGYGQEDSHDDYDSVYYDSTAHTPFGSNYMDTERFTPGPNTPGINEVSSPNFNPSSTPTTPGSFHTPHPNTPGHTPTTPGTYNMPPTTPGSYNSYIPTTPGGGYRPNTPGFNQYNSPFTDTNVNNTNNTIDEDNNWWTPHIEVEYNGKVGVISSCYANECEVAWSDGVSNTIEGSLLKPVIPKKKDKVIIIKGKEKGKKGELLQALLGDQNEGIIKCEDLSHLVVPLHSIARYVEQ